MTKIKTVKEIKHEWVVIATDLTINRLAYATDALWIFKNEEDARQYVEILERNGNYENISYKKFDRIFMS